MLMQLKRCLTRFVERQWYRPDLTILTASLLPFSWLFAATVKLRRLSYQKKYLASHLVNIPIIVVGNISVGGTGKTPCVIALAEHLVNQGFHPGIITRGYGGHQRTEKIVVEADHASDVGDEAVLLLRRTQCPVAIGVNRVRAAQLLARECPTCDVIISDDGLQHYSLQRDIEIAVIDGHRRVGNGRLLPAGPLRESLSRLHEVDFVLINGAISDSTFTMQMIAHDWQQLIQKEKGERVTMLQPGKVHAVAALGNPERFFNYLRMNGFEISEHVFPDHYQFSASDFNFGDMHPIVMTEKDAVKCVSIADSRMWYVPISAELNKEFLVCLDKKLQSKVKRTA